MKERTVGVVFKVTTDLDDKELLRKLSNDLAGSGSWGLTFYQVGNAVKVVSLSAIRKKNTP